eukprot:1736020-Prymnesium_polylepis.1
MARVRDARTPRAGSHTEVSVCIWVAHASEHRNIVHTPRYGITPRPREDSADMKAETGDLAKPAPPKPTPDTPKEKADWASASEQAKSEWDAFEPRFSIGRGQFGVVFLLQHPDGRKAVDKRVELSGMNDDQKKETEKEIDLLQRLAHDNIVRYFHKFVTTKDDASTLHIIMEYCDSGSLTDAIAEQQQERRAFPMDKVRRWTLQLCTALAHIHSMRVIHRDVKTANVFLSDAAGRPVADVKLGDFGISRL